MMGRGAGFWIWTILFGHGIGLVCMGMCVVKAGASQTKEIGGGSLPGRTSCSEIGG
jgi:hypothetical protein